MNLDNRTFSEKINFYEKTLLDDEFDLFNFIEDGFFSKHIKRYQKLFPPENIKIISSLKNTLKIYLNTLIHITKFSWKYDEPITFNKYNQKTHFRIPRNQLSADILLNKFYI